MSVSSSDVRKQTEEARSCAECQRRVEAARERDRTNEAFIKKVCQLSERERQVMLAICAGHMPSKMARRFHISVKTVSTYRSRILEKLNLKSNAAIAVACERAGLLP